MTKPSLLPYPAKMLLAVMLIARSFRSASWAADMPTVNLDLSKPGVAVSPTFTA
jgi:hypothetical protein